MPKPNAKPPAILNVQIPTDLKRLIDREKERSGLPIRVIAEKALRAYLITRAA